MKLTVDVICLLIAFADYLHKRPSISRKDGHLQNGGRFSVEIIRGMKRNNGEFIIPLFLL